LLVNKIKIRELKKNSEKKKREKILTKLKEKTKKKRRNQKKIKLATKKLNQNIYYKRHKINRHNITIKPKTKAK